MPDPKINIAERSFSGNPVMLSLYVGAALNARYRVYVIGEVTELLFTGDVYSLADWATVNISSVTDMGLASDLINFRIDLLDAEDAVVEEKQFTVYPGGISKLMQRKLAASGTNIFALKIKNQETNFFLSTRSFNTELFIPENELMPLYYYAKGMKFKIKASQNRYELDAIDGTGYPAEVLEGIDLAALRLYCAAEHDVWPSDFRIMTDNGWACTIIITESEPTPFFIKFLNSFGMWEKIALYLEAEYTPVITEKEKTLAYDASINSFKATNNRKEITNKYRFNTRYLNSEERLFLLDALLAKHTYLVAYDVEYEASFTTESDLFGATSAAPRSISIAAELADKDNYFSPLAADTIATITTGGNELTSNNTDITT